MNDEELLVQDQNPTPITNEDKIEAVLRLVIWGEDGKVFSVSKACKEVGIPRSTWYAWQKHGTVAEIKARLTSDMQQAAQNRVLPYIGKILDNVVQIALGESPNGSNVTASHMINAFRELKPLIGLDQPMQSTQGKTAATFLQTFQPQQINIGPSAVKEFLYSGQGVPKMGQIEQEVTDGEFVEDVIDVDIE